MLNQIGSSDSNEDDNYTMNIKSDRKIPDCHLKEELHESSTSDENLYFKVLRILIPAVAATTIR